jgi:hypothetical protein
LALDGVGARIAAERLLTEAAVARDTLELSLPPSRLALEVGDAIAVAGQSEGPFEVTEIRDGLARKLVARAIPPVLEAAIIADRPLPGSGESLAWAIPVFAAVHLPPEPAMPAQSRLALAASASPWPGTVSIADATTGTELARLRRSATLGELLSPLAAGTPHGWDRTSRPHLRLYGGHVAAAEDELVLAGGNRIAVQTDAGDWEVIGFAEAELLAPGEYRLTRLLRGQAGTDWAMGPAAAGNRVVLLDAGPAIQPLPADWLGTTATLRGYVGRADETGTPFTALAGLGPVLPLAPVHLRAERAAGAGDVALSWLRRSRADPDNWALEAAPLEIVPEAYRVSILAGGTPLRVLESTAPTLVYGAVEQAEDFGALPEAFDFSVAQLSPVYGPGHAATGSFSA